MLNVGSLGQTLVSWDVSSIGELIGTSLGNSFLLSHLSSVPWLEVVYNVLIVAVFVRADVLSGLIAEVEVS